ncbi:MAG: ATP-binding protein [Salinirussus sp.]
MHSPRPLRYCEHSNAIEHNDSPEPRVAIRGREGDSGVCLVVADDGPGIPDAEWQAIETGHEDATGHATGLGLWGTKWAIQTLGGELSRENSDLGGTAVVIELPLPTAPST